MSHHRQLAAAVLCAATLTASAGGINTNTNLSAAFDRMLSRDGAIGIDGVYSNPAGVAFLAPGLHTSINWQMAFQSRTIDNRYPLFVNNTNAPREDRHFRGHAFAPVIPSVQAAYNRGKFSFQFGFGLTGGGGKCTFDDGLGSFERIVSETALASSGLARTVDASLANTLMAAGVPQAQVSALAAHGFSSDNFFGSTGQYSYDSYMRGRQYYYGFQLGVAYKARPDLAVYAGVRGVYALCNYYGYVSNISVGNVPLYQVLDPTRPNSADIELNCDQQGLGFTPVLGVDWKVGRWNFAAKYEFKTRMRLKNESVNSIPSIGNLSANLGTALVTTLQGHGMDAATAQAVGIGTLTSPEVTATMTALKDHFDKGISEAIGEYADDAKVPADLPSILTLGVSYSPMDQLRLNAGFHYFFDKQAKQYNDRQKKLDRGTIEYSFGAEYDATKWLTVSLGTQRTSYGLTSEYMDDKSFVASSVSLGGGAAMRLSRKTRLNVAYFHSFYGTEKTNTVSPNTGMQYAADYTRNNNVLAVGVDIDF